MTPDPRERFLTLLREALAARTLKRLVLSRPARPMFPPGFTNEGPVLQRLRIQPVRMRDGVKLAFAWQYDTRDQTDNLSVDEALVRIDALLGDMRTALLETRELTAELGFSKRGRPLFRMKRVTETPSLQERRPAADDLPNPNPNPNPKEGEQASAGGAASWQPGVGALTQLRRVGSGKTAARAVGDAFSRSHDTLPDEDGWGELADHNRQRRYPVDIGRPYLVDLGIVGRTGALVPAMARKWRQINKFVEIVAQAWQHNTLANRVGRAGQPPLRIRDYGAGKGYLTFALYDYLTHTLGLQVEMVGIERRADLVALCNRLAQRHGLSGLRFEKGDILQACEVAEAAPGAAARGTDVAGVIDGRAAAGVAGVGADAEQSRDSGATASDGTAVAAAGDPGLRGAGVRVHQPRTHGQEQDDPGQPHRPGAGCRCGAGRDRGAETLLWHPHAAAGWAAGRRDGRSRESRRKLTPPTAYSLQFDHVQPITQHLAGQRHQVVVVREQDHLHAA